MRAIMAVTVLSLLAPAGCGGPTPTPNDSPPMPTATARAIVVTATPHPPDPVLAPTATPTPVPTATSVPSAALPTSTPPLINALTPTATVGISGPTLPLGRLPIQPNARAHRNTRQGSETLLVFDPTDPPDVVAAWMIEAWQGFGLRYRCNTTLKNNPSLHIFVWSDGFANTYQFALAPPITAGTSAAM